MSAATPSSRYGRPWSLRVRVTAAFALGSLVIIGVLGIASYLIAQHYLVRAREGSLQRQAFVDARVVRDELASGSSVSESLGSLDLGPRSQVVVSEGDRWLGTSRSSGRELVPTSIRQEVARGRAARQRISVDGLPTFVVGLPLSDTNLDYYEVFTLVELDRTLQTLRTALIGGGVLAAVFGGFLGWWMSRRALRPVSDFAAAAERVAGGDFHTRLDPSPDADLTSLVTSFNHMVDAVERRIQRETRFVSDVSHELRSPLTAISTATDVMAARRDELSPRARDAFDLLESEVHALDQLVEDLLELGRADAGVAEMQLEHVDVGELVTEWIRRSGTKDVDLVAPATAVRARVDKRRLDRVLANLVANAELHGGGLRRVAVRQANGSVRVEVEDEGPGVASADRERVFHRFYRGAAAGRRASAAGAGLGLSLVAEHVQLHGGRVWIEDGDTGGARFVVELPGAGR